MNWREQIEVQIEFLRQDMMYHDAADDMQALLDVAVAAHLVTQPSNLFKPESSSMAALSNALDKLREVGDE